MKIRVVTLLVFAIFSIIANGQTKPINKTKEYEVATYYFPAYHPDSINSKWHGKGWTEWDLVKAAKPKFKGHEQPKVPAWGYFDESDPKWAAKEIDLAADNGIDCFIYDWYWYPAIGGPYMHEALEKGFLKAPNRNRMKFSLMWANHDWYNVMPASFENTWTKYAEAEVSMGLWDTMSTYIVDKYFKQPNYWKIDGKPYFSIYQIATFINGVGGIEKAKEAIQMLENKAKKAGFPGIHLNLMSAGITFKSVKLISGDDAPKTGKELLTSLPCESVSTYAYLADPSIHQMNFTKPGTPTETYNETYAQYKKFRESFVKDYPNILYTASVPMGWDSTPRCEQSDIFALKGYPWLPVIVGNTPDAYKRALLDTKQFLDRYNPKHKIVILNAWNEWTEGSYLLPEKKYGDAYLKAVKDVYGIGSY